MYRKITNNLAIFEDIANFKKQLSSNLTIEEINLFKKEGRK